ncbi:hypothetical protein SLA2020_212910 [Shorea laevis]
MKPIICFLWNPWLELCFEPICLLLSPKISTNQNPRFLHVRREFRRQPPCTITCGAGFVYDQHKDIQIYLIISKVLWQSRSRLLL